MVRILDRVIFHVARLGWVGGLGIVLLAGAMGADALLLRPMEAQLDKLVDANQKALLMPAKARQEKTRAQALPELEPEAAAALKRVFDAARGEGIELMRGDYRQVQEQGAGFKRYQFTLPVAGTYPEIRAFLSDVLADEPALALNGLLLRRDSIESPEVEATLRFTLYLEAGS